MIARSALLLVPFLVVGIAMVHGPAVTLGHLPASLFVAGSISASEELAVAESIRRLRMARMIGALVGALAFAVPTLMLRHSLQLNFSALLAGAVLGVVVAQWWVRRIPRRTRRSASLARRRLVDLVGLPPLILFGLTSGLAVLADCSWIVLRSRIPGAAHRLSNGQLCVPPTVSSVQHHLLSWTVLGPVLLISFGGALLTLHRAIDPTMSVTADLAIRAAAIRTALGCGIVFAGGHAISTYADSTAFTSQSGCLPGTPGWDNVLGPVILVLVPALCWCVGVYLLAPARKPMPLAASRTREVVASV